MDTFAFLTMSVAVAYKLWVSYEKRPPQKIIAFVGATSAGKTSTINALLGSNQFAVAPTHGTTQHNVDTPFQSKYSLRDTPGILNDIDTDSRWRRSLRDCDLIIYVTVGELFQQELDALIALRKQQQLWDQKSGSGEQRYMALYINKIDYWKATMTKRERGDAYYRICSQVDNWITARMIVSGSSAPVVQGRKVAPQIDELQGLITKHISQQNRK